MEEWKEYRLGEVIETNISQYSLKENWESILYLDTGNITKNQISNIESFFGNKNLPSRARRKVKKDDIVYSSVRPNLCHYGYMNNPPSNLLVSTGFIVITVKKELADSRFIYYYLTKNEIVKHLHAIGEQAVSTYPSIKPSDIEDLPINLPSLENQQKIASILKSLDDKIAINRRINDNLEQQAQALFKSWFVDFEPFKDGEFVESELGMIPKGWRVGNLGEFVETTSGGTPSRKIENYYKNGTFCWIKSKELINGFIYDTEEKITEEAIKKSSAKLLPKHSILIAMYGATVGEFGIISYPMTCNQAICALIPNANVPYSVLYLFALNNKINLQNKAVGSAQQNISQVIIKGLGFLYNEKVFKEFNGIVEPMLKQIEKNTIEIIHLSKLRDILLPQLMSGNLQVDELSL